MEDDSINDVSMNQWRLIIETKQRSVFSFLSHFRDEAHWFIYIHEKPGKEFFTEIFMCTEKICLYF
jgi:hypothetical protein